MEMGAEYKPDWNSDCTLLMINIGPQISKVMVIFMIYSHFLKLFPLYSKSFSFYNADFWW